MLTIWRKAHLFDPDRATSAAWIYTIARNLRLSLQRRGSTKLHEIDLSFGAEEPTPPDALMVAAQNSQQVRAALLSLNADQAAAIELAFFGGHTHLAISQKLGVPLGTIKARIRFGMIRMRTILERQSGDAA